MTREWMWRATLPPTDPRMSPAPAEPAPALAAFLSHRPMLRAFVRGLLDDASVADDVLQEGWLRFERAWLEAQARQQPIAQPAAYLHRIMRNLAYDHLRRVASDAWLADGQAQLDTLVSPDPGPERRAADGDELAAVVAALAEVPERSRRAFDMHRFQRRTYGEIGHALGISQARAHDLVRQVVAHCAARLGRQPDTKE